MTRKLSALVLVIGLLLAGCGGSGTSTATSGTTTGSSSSSGPAAGATTSDSGTASAGATDASGCPTENTRSFAKTRFAADVGGSIFLVNRYLLKPYQAGKFTKGASGRRTALIKAGLAAAATARLLNNASENAKANPTLCRRVAGPLSQLTSQVKNLPTLLATGAVTGSTLTGVTGLLGKVTSGSGSAGVPVQEQNPGLPGLG